MTANDIDTVLRGQVGVVLGVLLCAVLGVGFFHFVINRLIRVTCQQILEKLDAMIASNRAAINATNILSRAVANLLLASRLSVMQERGRETISEITKNEEEK